MIPGSTSLQAIFGVGGGTQWIINHLSLVSLGFEADSEYTYVTLSKLNLFDASNKMLFGAIADFQNYIRHNTRLWQIVSLFFFSCTSSQMGLGRRWSVLLCLPSGINRVYHTVIYLYVAHSSVYPWNSKAGETAGVQKIAWKIPCHVFLAASLPRSPAVQRGVPSHSRTWGLFALHGGTELCGDVLCTLCSHRRVGFRRLSRSAPVFVLRWLAGGQIAIIQNCVAEENAWGYVFCRLRLTNRRSPFQLTLLSESDLRCRFGFFLGGKRCFLDLSL